ncbi:MAG: hypothetical protein ACK4GT_06040 [Pararhodobacter sp.]
MPPVLRRFFVEDSGAVTIDWVVLTGIAIAFGMMVLTALTTGTTDVAAQMETSLTDLDVAPLGGLGYAP